MSTVKCNNCDWQGEESQLDLIEMDNNGIVTAIEDSFGNVFRSSCSPKNSEFIKGCPNCHTDNYLMDIE